MIAAGNLRWDALPPLWLIVLVIVPLVALSVRFIYRREAGRVGRRLRIGMGGLRVLAIMLVFVAIWGPYTEEIESRPFKRHLILALDTSDSMNFKDDYETSRSLAERIAKAAGYGPGAALNGKTRFEIARDVITADAASNNHGAVNQGQVKWIAKQAYYEFSVGVPGGGNECRFRDPGE